MKIECFEDIIAWKKAKEITVTIYTLLTGNRDYGFKDQIQRASLSIMNNIAEGFERRGDREFKKFLFIAKGSCAEVRSMLYLAHDLNYFNESDCDKLTNRCIEVSRMISGLIETLE